MTGEKLSVEAINFRNARKTHRIYTGKFQPFRQECWTLPFFKLPELRGLFTSPAAAIALTAIMVSRLWLEARRVYRIL